MQPTYPDRTPDQRLDRTPEQTTDPAPSAPPDDGYQPTEPVRPVAYEEQPARAVPVEPELRAPVVTRAHRGATIVWFVLGIVEALLIIRVVLKALGANPAAGFSQLVYSVSAPLVLPFQGIFPTPVTSRSVLELSALVAIVVYALIAWGIVRLITILDPRQDQGAI
jgi:uncharacterized protein YggT (Ycf19 family)